MEKLRACVLLLGLISQCFVTPALSRATEGSTFKPECDCPTPSHHHGGGHHSRTPSSPGGGHHSPTPSHSSPVTPTPSTPSTPSHGGYHPTPPSTPIITPPATPSTPTTPSIPDPTGPPFSPGSCSYWISHPGAIVAIFGYWGTIGRSFGAACSAAFGKNISIQDALKNTRADGIGSLYREGTAALLNSIACRSFPFTSQQVKDAFSTAVSSDNAAAAQAALFKQANEGKLIHH